MNDFLTPQEKRRWEADKVIRHFGRGNLHSEKAKLAEMLLATLDELDEAQRKISALQNINPLAPEESSLEEFTQ